MRKSNEQLQRVARAAERVSGVRAVADGGAELLDAALHANSAR